MNIDDDKFSGSIDENNELAVRARNGDKEAQSLLVLNNQGLIHKIANRYARNEEDREDFFQDGVCGLMSAIKTYDETKGAFSTHATSWIRANILKNIRGQEDFHYDTSFYNKYMKYRKLQAACGKESNFSDDELFEYGLTRRDIQQIEKYGRQSYSLDAIYDNEEYNQSNDKILNPDKSVEDKVYLRELKHMVSEEMERILTPNELFVIRNMYGIDSDRVSMAKIANKLSALNSGKSYTRQRIQQIKKKAEAKLRDSSVLRSLFIS